MTLTTITTAEAIVATSQQNGGGTFAPSGLPVTSGIAVTVEVVGKADTLTEADIETALAAVQPNEAVGTWFDQENGVWEISRTWVCEQSFRQAAFEFAAAAGERYVYDLDADECVAVS